MKAHELLSGPSKWTKGTFAESALGPVLHNSVDAVKWCLSGALMRCYGVDTLSIGDPLYIKVLTQIQTEFPEHNAICEWNDDPSRTFEEVRAILLKLDV